MKSVVNKDEIHRLKKAARDGDKTKLYDWAVQFESQIRADLLKEYQDNLGSDISNFILSIAYVLHFSETTKFGKNRILSFMEDLFVTVDMFRTGEYNPDEYVEQLKQDGLILDSGFDYSKIYREKYNEINQALDDKDIEKAKEILNKVKNERI